MNKDRFILMGDVVASGTKEPIFLARDLQRIVTKTNSELSGDILSPLTVTLGDEFQGICHSLESAIQVVLQLERELLRNGRVFRFRYVIFEGRIDTPINTDTSYGMLGDGLTRARHMLTDKSRNREIVECSLNDEKRQRLLNYVFQIFTSYWEVSTARKYPEILEMLLYDQIADTSVAERSNKTRAEIWKFRRNWQINIYVSALNILREKLY